jgi:hypothetical protein
MKRKYNAASKRRKVGWESPKFPERYLAQLREAGLFVTECGDEQVILKPKTVPGNCVPGSHDEPPLLPSDRVGPSIPPSDAPHTYLWREGGKRAAAVAELAANPKAHRCCVRGCMEQNLGYADFCQRHYKPSWPYKL